MMLINLFHGFCMALADSVPGVSGGTIAFILGFYDKFLNSLHDLFGRDRAARLPALRYLAKLGAGWVIGMALAATVLAQVFDSGVYVLSSAFLGLTVASLPFILKEERETLRGHASSMLFAVAGVALVVGLVTLRGANIGGTLSLSDLQAWQYLYLLQTGMLAIMAMVLPGISGSTLLLVFGAYMPVITALRLAALQHVPGCFQPTQHCYAAQETREAECSEGQRRLRDRKCGRTHDNRIQRTQHQSNDKPNHLRAELPASQREPWKRSSAENRLSIPAGQRSTQRYGGHGGCRRTAFTG